jgi:hypothetical protein
MLTYEFWRVINEKGISKETLRKVNMYKRDVQKDVRMPVKRRTNACKAPYESSAAKLPTSLAL